MFYVKATFNFEKKAPFYSYITMSKIRSIVKLHNIFHEQALSIGKKKKKNVKTVIILLLGSHILFQIFY